MTEAEKLNLIKQAFKVKIMRIETLEDMRVLIQNVTTGKIKTMIMNSLAVSKQEATDSATESTEAASDLQDLSDEIGAL